MVRTTSMPRDEPRERRTSHSPAAMAPTKPPSIAQSRVPSAEERRRANGSVRRPPVDVSAATIGHRAAASEPPISRTAVIDGSFRARSTARSTRSLSPTSTSVSRSSARRRCPRSGSIRYITPAPSAAPPSIVITFAMPSLLLLFPPVAVSPLEDLGRRTELFVGRARHAECVTGGIHTVLVGRGYRASGRFLADAVGATPVRIDVAAGQRRARGRLLLQRLLFLPGSVAAELHRLARGWALKRRVRGRACTLVRRLGRRWLRRAAGRPLPLRCLHCQRSQRKTCQRSSGGKDHMRAADSTRRGGAAIAPERGLMASLPDGLVQSLEDVATRLRIDSVRATTAAGSGHPTSAASAADLVA